MTQVATVIREIPKGRKGASVMQNGLTELQAAFVREYATDFCAKGAVTELPPVQGDCIGGLAQLPSQSAEWLLPLIIALYDYRHLRSVLMYNFLGFM